MRSGLKKGIGRGILLAILLAAVGPLAGQDPGMDLTLKQAVQMALDSNPMIRASASGERLAEAQLDEAKAGRLPSLQFDETFTHSNNPVFAFGTLLEQGRFGPGNFAIDSLNNPGSLSNFRSQVNLKIPIFNRFQVGNHIEQARLGREQARSRRLQVQQQIRFQVLAAYYGILVAQAHKQVADEARGSAEAELKRIRDRYEQGMVVESELLAMQVQLSEFRQQQIAAQGEVISAYAALNTVLGQPLDASFRILGTLQDRAFPPSSQPQLVKAALQHRPDYREAELKSERLRKEIRTSRGQYLPDLNLFGDFGNSGRDLSSGSSDFAVGASLTFNILDFGRSPRIEQARAAWEAARAEQQHKADQIRLQVVRSYQAYRAARQQLQVAGGAVQQAQEVLRIVEDRHGAGLTTITEVLRAQTALVRARMNLSNARFQYYMGYARTLLSSGRLDDVAPFVS